MNPKLVSFRILALAGLAGCMLLLIESMRPTPAFCGFRSGCVEVAQSAYARPLGIPLPIVGLVTYLAFFAMTLYSACQRRLLGAAAIVAGIAGAALVAIQWFVLRQICPLCLIPDAAGMLLAAIELAFPSPKDPSPPVGHRRWAWVAAAVVAVSSLLIWSVVQPAPQPPSEVKALWVADRVNVVEITDFACPYCRQTHPAVRDFLSRHGDKVNFVRVVVPLDRHEHARSAAKAYWCAVGQNKGSEMAEALFAAEDLSPASLHRMAEKIGILANDLDACFSDPTLDKQLDDSTRWVLAADHGGLPQIWVEDVLAVGLQTSESLDAALTRAAGKSRW